MNPIEPNHPDLSPADLREAILLRLDEENWKEFADAQGLLPGSDPDAGPVKTGDPWVDEMERRFFKEGE